MAPFIRVETAFDERLVGIPGRLLAMFTVHANQTLGENAVQGGNEVVRLDADVQEAPENVDHVVGVNGGEYQVAGEGGVDGDLGGLLIADFADHDLIRIVSQDGAKAAREGEPLLFVDGDLGDALELIFDGIFDGDDLVFV